MSQAPAMPLWTDALIGDTTHLSAEEFGAYLLILIATWRNNGQPFADDDARLARICRVTTPRWLQKLRPVLVSFYDLSGGTWRQKRLEKEWKYVTELSGIQSAKGKRSGEARRLKKNDTQGTAVAPGFEPEGEPKANPHTHTHKKEETLPAEIVPFPARETRARSDLAFEGETIRLTEPDLTRWRKAFPAIPNLIAELTCIDAWFRDHPDKAKSWFSPTAGMLAKKNQEMAEIPIDLRRKLQERRVWDLKVSLGEAM